MFREFGYSDIVLLVSATRYTLILAFFSLAIGGCLGVVVALCRISPIGFLRSASGAFVVILQGTPVLIQLVLVFFGMSLVGYNVDPWTAAIIALTLHTCAYLGEIWRGIISSLPRGQFEAADALALTYAQKMSIVILPQALRFAVPPTLGFVVHLIKMTSLASVIGFVEVTRAGQLINSSTLQPIATFGTVAIIYFFICWPLSMLVSRLETNDDHLRI